MSFRILLPLCCLSFSAALASQSGRSMQLRAPAVIGQTALFGMQHPVSVAGNIYVLLWSPPFAGVVPVLLPGLTVSGLARVDLANVTFAAAGILDTTGMTPSLAVPIPANASLVGYAWDLQSVDLDAAGTWTLADDDLAMVVSAPPLPSLNMVPIAAGTFQMGSVTVGGAATPVHAVTISRPFWMGRTEVTQAQYQAVMGSNPSWFQGPSWPNYPNRPVETISWNDAVAYCDALTVQEAAAGRLPTGYEYRLPTEAEWEYCCRAGTTTEWNVGNSVLCSQANLGNGGAPFCVPPGQTTVVGSYAANAWGLHDMHGNLWEWCLDGSNGPVNYPSGPITDPYVPSSSGPSRVFRGGSWFFFIDASRSAVRFAGLPTSSGAVSDFGFRVVCAPALP